MGASHSPRPKPCWTRLTIRIRGAGHEVRLLNPRPLEMTTIPIIMRICALNANSGRPGVGERGRLSFGAVPMIVISDKRRVLGRLVIGRREHFASTRHELIERR